MRRLLGLSVLLWLLHFAVLRALAGADFMAALARARHGSPATALAFALLLVLRVAALVIVPPLLVASSGTWLLRRRQRGQAATQSA